MSTKELGKQYWARMQALRDKDEAAREQRRKDRRVTLDVRLYPNYDMPEELSMAMGCAYEIARHVDVMPGIAKRDGSIAMRMGGSFHALENCACWMCSEDWSDWALPGGEDDDEG